MKNKLFDKKFMALTVGLVVSVLQLLNVNGETISRWYVFLAQAIIIVGYIREQNKYEIECELKNESKCHKKSGGCCGDKQS